MKAIFARTLVTALTTCATALPLPAAHWPAWRGANGTGISTEKDLPVQWGTNQNVRWRVDLPGPGNSSPIVWGERVFITQAVSSQNRRTLMCFERKTGKLQWQSGVTYTDREPTQRSNPYCSATPVTDGERVVAFFGSAGLYCYDLEGKELWHRDLGKLNHVFGNGSSPVLAGDLCVLNFGPDEKARLIAVHKRTGDTVWEAAPPKVDPGEQQAARGGTPGGSGQAGRGGGFGIGTGVAPQLFSQADRNGDRKLTRQEFAALGDVWFDKLDPDKVGQLNRDQFAERFYDAVPPRDASGAGQQPGTRRPSRTTGPAFFTAADTDKDGTLTRAELKDAFGKWFEEWDKDRTGALTEEQLRDGLNAVLPRTETAGGQPAGDRGAGGGRTGGPGGRGGGGGGSWSSPILIEAGGREELVVCFPNRLAAYEPKTGKQLWLSKGLGGTIYTTPLWGEDTLFATTSGPGGGGAIAVRPGGTDDVTASRQVWRLERAKSAIGSGVIQQGHLYTISQDGVAECLDLKTGTTVWEERLRGPGSRNSSWSSMLLADGKIFVPNQSGDVFVLRAAPRFELLSTNSVGEPTNASLAVSGGDVFLRTDKSLWCLSAAKQ